MHIIKCLPSKHRVIMTFVHYDDHDPDRFLKETHEAVLSVKGASQSFDLLADFSAIMVMPQDIAQESEALASWLVSNGLRRSANIIGTITQRMQIQRVTDRDSKFGYFQTLEEGEAWLDEGQI